MEVKNITVKGEVRHEDAMCRLGIYKRKGHEIEISENQLLPSNSTATILHSV